MGHGMWGGPMPGMMGMMRQPGPSRTTGVEGRGVFSGFHHGVLRKT